MTDRETFLAKLSAEPGDLVTAAVFADWLDEYGEPAVAHAFRWMASRGFYPYHRDRKNSTRFNHATLRYERVTVRVAELFSWAWYPWNFYATTGSRAEGILPPSCLPVLVFKALGKGPPDHRYYPSYEKAVIGLADALEWLRLAYQLDGVRPAGPGKPPSEVLT